jgi:hypothetical protein
VTIAEKHSSLTTWVLTRQLTNAGMASLSKRSCIAFWEMDAAECSTVSRCARFVPEGF